MTLPEHGLAGVDPDSPVAVQAMAAALREQRVALWREIWQRCEAAEALAEREGVRADKAERSLKKLRDEVIARLVK